MSDQFFRAGVGIVITDGGGLVLGFERIPEGSDRWQFPQGGVGPGDEPWEAALRELEEEIGLGPDDVEKLAEHPEWLAYELPDRARSKKTGRGQVQKWFLVRLVSGVEALDLGGRGGSPAEFARWRWMKMADMADGVWSVRKVVYDRLAKDFDPILAGRARASRSPLDSGTG